MSTVESSPAPAASATRARNVTIHVASLSCTKLADGLIDPKLVLSWLLTSLGAPALVIGLLVPVREAGALLPQLFISARIRAMRAARYAWAGGSAAQGVAAAAIAGTAWLLDGALAGAVIVALLAALAVARSVCSASYKHVLGKTVAKRTRGRTTGLAGSIAAAGVLAFAAILTFGPGASLGLVTGAIILAASLWLAAAALFTRLDEPESSHDGDTDAASSALRNLKLLRTDTALRRFILTRGLLITTALAPPFVVTLGEASLDRLGWMVAASSLAALVSSVVWGRLSDRSSRKVLILSGAVSAAILAATALLGEGSSAAVTAALLFGLMIAYQGVRLGRSTHLVDMATEDTRAAYTAVSNTAIGLLLLAGGLYGVIAHTFGTVPVLWLMAAQSALGALAATTLSEVQQQG